MNQPKFQIGEEVIVVSWKLGVWSSTIDRIFDASIPPSDCGYFLCDGPVRPPVPEHALRKTYTTFSELMSFLKSGATV